MWIPVEDSQITAVDSIQDPIKLHEWDPYVQDGMVNVDRRQKLLYKLYNLRF